MLMLAGVQLPIIPFVEVVGRATGGEFSQRGPTPLKIGVTWLVIVTLIVAVVPH